jgi:hypothetical protein
LPGGVILTGVVSSWLTRDCVPVFEWGRKKKRGRGEDSEGGEEKGD